MPQKCMVPAVTFGRDRINWSEINKSVLYDILIGTFVCKMSGFVDALICVHFVWKKNGGVPQFCEVHEITS